MNLRDKNNKKLEDPALRKQFESLTCLGDAIQREERGDLKGALKVLKKALYADPNNDGAWNELSTVLQRQGDIDGAIDALILSVLRSADDPQFFAWFNLSKLLARRGRDAEAYYCLQKAQKIEIKEPGPPLILDPANPRGPRIPNPKFTEENRQRMKAIMAVTLPRIQQEMRASVQHFEDKKVVPVPPKEPGLSRFI